MLPDYSQFSLSTPPHWSTSSVLALKVWYRCNPQLSYSHFCRHSFPPIHTHSHSLTPTSVSACMHFKIFHSPMLLLKTSFEESIFFLLLSNRFFLLHWGGGELFSFYQCNNAGSAVVKFYKVMLTLSWSVLIYTALLINHSPVLTFPDINNTAAPWPAQKRKKWPRLQFVFFLQILANCFFFLCLTKCQNCISLYLC